MKFSAVGENAQQNQVYSEATGNLQWFLFQN
jgi:hypothetical protein